jgi:hypothetical protein
VSMFDGSDSELPVTNDNKAQCVIAKVQRTLLVEPRAALNCMRKGFRLAAQSGQGEPAVDITSHLALFSANELMDAVFGDEILSASQFERHVRYDEGVGSNVRSHLHTFVQSADERALRDLLRFITGNEAFSEHRSAQLNTATGAAKEEEEEEKDEDDKNKGDDGEEDGEAEEGEEGNGKGNELWVLQHADVGRLPMARTCFRQLLLPDEPEYDTFQRKLETAVREGLAGGFQME